MRRCPTFFDKSIPNPNDHRPDGYWTKKSNRGHIFISLELERSIKQIDRYKTLNHFYEDHSQIIAVIWIVPTKSNAIKLSKVFNSEATNNFKHHFFLIEDFLLQGWASRSIIGPQNDITISSLLNSTLGNQFGTSMEHVPQTILIDSRLSHRHLTKYWKNRRPANS